VLRLIALANSCLPENYTEVERSQHLIQSDPRIFGAKYVAQCSSVNGQDAFRGEKTDHRHIEYFQSVSKYREEGLPCQLPAHLEEDIQRDPIICELASQVQTASSDDATRNAKRALANALRQQRRVRLDAYQEQWIKDRRDWKIKTRGEEAAKNPSKTDFVRDLSVWMPERERLAKRIASDRPLTSDEMWLAMRDLYSLCAKDQIVLYLPQVTPVDEACPVKDCKIAVKR
jgi:Protein of unknown function (DUF3435)